jgi:hypothetical protein
MSSKYAQLFSIYFSLNQNEQSSRWHHVANLESLFLPVIELLQKYAGPFANEKCRHEMEESMFYTVEVVQLPSGAWDWVCPHFYHSCGI